MLDISDVMIDSFGILGLLHLKDMQDCDLPPHEHYIRLAVEVQETDLLHGSACTEEESSHPLQVVICMLPQSSEQLQLAQYVQSDIGFKRVVGFYELEISGIVSKSNIGQSFLCYWI